MLWSIVYINMYCVGAEISTFMSISDGLGLYTFGRKMEKTGPAREEMDENVFYFLP